MSNPIWTICVVGLERRRRLSKELHELLMHLEYNSEGDLEVLWHWYGYCEGPSSIGDRRNFLLRKATGEYISFIDDDDTVEPAALMQVCEALEKGPDAVGFLGVFQNWLDPQGFRDYHLFAHTIQAPGWVTRPDGLRLRTPNHINPVKRELALKCPFPLISHGEDAAYSKALRPLLKRELFLPRVFYYYRKNFEQYWNLNHE